MTNNASPVCIFMSLIIAVVFFTVVKHTNTRAKEINQCIADRGILHRF